MEEIRSKYALITGDYIHLYNDYNNIPGVGISDDLVEDVTITFNENGSVTIEGELWKYFFSWDDVKPQDLDYKVHPDYIKKTFFGKKDIVRKGWHRGLKNEHCKIIMNKYKISLLDN